MDPNWRLYDLEYIPCPVEAALDFSNNLSSTIVNPNTARWRIRIPKEVLGLSGTDLAMADHQLEVRTRIGDDLTSGRAYPTMNDPANLSTTYAWWVDSLEDVPYTERRSMSATRGTCRTPTASTGAPATRTPTTRTSTTSTTAPTPRRCGRPSRPAASPTGGWARSRSTTPATPSSSARRSAARARCGAR
ncbi:MAG: hypothetical protein R3F30_13020 [Planctomycetota bacterium]